MPNYQNGKIYKLVSDFTDEIYIGSTVAKLSKRFGNHKDSFKKNFRPCNSTKLFELGEVKIILIENAPCNSKEELLAIERKHIENNKCLNQIIPGRTRKEYAEENKEKIQKYRKEHYIKNSKKIKNYQKEHREKNKEELNQKKKQYREKNKDKIKEYREKNKEDLKKKRSEKITCECGSIVSKGCLTRHKKRQIHQSYLSNK